MQASKALAQNSSVAATNVPTPTSLRAWRASRTFQSGLGAKKFLQCVEAAGPTAVVVITKFDGREGGVRQHDFGGIAARKELHGDQRVFAAGMKIFPARGVFGPVPGEDDLFRRRHFAVDALAPIHLVLCWIVDFHAPAAAGANVLLVMNDFVRRHIATHPLF